GCCYCGQATRHTRERRQRGIQPVRPDGLRFLDRATGEVPVIDRAVGQTRDYRITDPHDLGDVALQLAVKGVVRDAVRAYHHVVDGHRLDRIRQHVGHGDLV